MPYRTIRSRAVRPYPSDSWYEGELAFVVFDLFSLGAVANGGNDEYSQAVFVLDADSGQLLAARLVEAENYGEPAIYDLLAD